MGNNCYYSAQKPCHSCLGQKNSTIRSPERNSMVRETAINCREAPRLRGNSTKQFIAPKRLLRLYEKQIEEKSRHLKEDIIPTSYRTCIKEDDFRTIFAAGWIETNSIEKLTERPIEQCVEERCKCKDNGEQLYLIDQAGKKVARQMHIVVPEGLLWTLQREYCK